MTAEVTQETDSGKEVPVPGRKPLPSPSMRLARGELIFGILLVLPIISILALVLGFPLISAVNTSLRDENIIGSASEFVGFQTYLTVLRDVAFWEALRRSGVWLVLNLVVQGILAFATALLLRRSGWWSRTARIWVMLPWVIPTVAVAVIWQWMLNSNYGVIHHLLGEAGIDLGAPFGNPTWALYTIILVNSWHWFPLVAVVIYGALATIPDELYEAARMDGANAWQAFWRITFPLLQPILFALGLVGSLWSVNILDSIYLITEGGPAGSTTTMPVYVYDTAFSAFRSSHAAAASVLTVLVLTIAALLFVRLARPKEDY